MRPDQVFAFTTRIENFHKVLDRLGHVFEGRKPRILDITPLESNYDYMLRLCHGGYVKKTRMMGFDAQSFSIIRNTHEHPQRRDSILPEK